jgi:hypothetical protein
MSTIALLVALLIFSKGIKIFSAYEFDGDITTGEFSIYIGGSSWFTSGSVYMNISGTVYSVANNNLVYEYIEHSQGEDVLGSYRQHSMVWTTTGDSGVSMKGFINLYHDCIVFEQSFVSDVLVIHIVMYMLIIISLIY